MSGLFSPPGDLPCPPDTPPTPPSPWAAPRVWDIACRVVDNFGDLGVSWRLARQLHARGAQVRLWVDDLSLAARMTTPGAGLEVLPWPTGHTLGAYSDAVRRHPPEVLVEMFGGDVPVPLLSALVPHGVWVNLEYLSAEDYVERSHGLPSPQFSGPAAGRTRWFFYPGFTSATGGLLREPELSARQRGFDPTAWRTHWGVPGRGPSDRPQHHMSLFGYAQAPLEPWLDAWVAAQAAQGRDTVIWACVGPLQARALAWHQQRPAVHAQAQVVCLPWLSQDAFDELLWACDLNAVRGEDSLARSIWARTPQLWQLYPQDDGAHHHKLEAFLQQQGTARSPWAAVVRWWNGGGQSNRSGPGLCEADLPALARDCAAPAAWTPLAYRIRQWGEGLAAQPSLVDSLAEFVALRMKG